MKVKDTAVAQRLLNIYTSARKRKIVCTLSFKKLKQLMQQEKCYYTGVKFEPGVEGLFQSVDRVDNTRGYEDDNVVMCVSQFNSLKGCLMPKDILLIYNKVFGFINRKTDKKNVKVPKKAIGNKAARSAPMRSKDGTAKRATVTKGVDGRI